MNKTRNLRKPSDRRFVVVALIIDERGKRFERASGRDLLTRSEAIACVQEQWALDRRAQIHIPKM